MGLTSWEGKQIRRSDMEIAKNYLTQTELDAMNKIVSTYLDIAEVRALAHEEYEKYRKKQDELPSQVEQHFIESIRELEALE